MPESTDANAPKLVPPPEPFDGKSALDSLPESPMPEQERDELDYVKAALNVFPEDLRNEVKGFFI